MKISTLHEDYCPACGGSDSDPFTDPTAGWPHGKVMTGHRYKCPVGEMGTPIKRTTSAVLANPVLVNCDAWKGRSIAWWYDKIKEFSGTLVGFTEAYAHWYNFNIGFDNPEDAAAFSHELSHDPGPGNFMIDIDELPGWYRDAYESGSFDARFVREYDLS
jgi:hypothetical protein